MTEFNPFNEAVSKLSPKTAGRAVWSSGLRLDRAENPFPPSPLVTEALTRWAGEANRYPEPDCATLRLRVAEYVGCDAAQLLIGNGSDELIDTIERSCLADGDQIVAPAPSFYFYHRSCSTNGGDTVFVPTTPELELDVEAILAAVGSSTKAVFIANPNNPTGRLASHETIEKLVSRCPCLVVVDECYWEFSAWTIADKVMQYPNLLVLRSFSKAFGLAGMRLGYAIGRPALIERLYAAMQPFPVNGATQAVGIAALSDLAYMRSRVDYLKAEVMRLSAELGGLGLRCYPTSTNFVLANSSSMRMKATEIVTRLKQKDIHVWDCTGTPGAGEYSFRVTTGSKEENRAFMRALRLILPAVGAS